MKRLTTLCFALSLALTGCSLLQTGTETPRTGTVINSLKTPSGVVNMNVRIYEYSPTAVPELTALLPQEETRSTFTLVSPSLEAVINQQAAAAKIQLKYQLQADTPSGHATPFSVTHYNVLQTEEGLRIHGENDYTDSLAMAITPVYTPDAENIHLSMELTQTDNKNTINFRQRLSLPMGKKMLFITPVSPDRMRLIIVTPAMGGA